jgi:histidyl-tRNA synthetase
MFRAERPQAGRFRQFHQYGVEAIGSHSPWVDVEVIALCLHILQACGVNEIALWLASMGCRDDQRRSAARLRKRIAPHRAKLCNDCKARFAKNVFRVLDCKNPTCQKLVWAFNGSPFVLCKECTAHFEAVRKGLGDAGVAFDDTQVFARGLDYYTRTVFEVRAKGLGVKDAVAAGGRYDHLVEELGGPSLGAVGFAAGTERLLMAMEHAHAAPSRPQARRGLYLAVADPKLVGEGFRFVQELRAQGVSAVFDYDGRSLKAQLREADKARVRLVAILGPQELAQRAMSVKDLEQGAQETLGFDRFAAHIADRLKQSSPCH